MTATTTRPHTERPQTPERLGYLSGILTVFGLEMRRRLRSRGWYIMLGIWFLVLVAVTLLTGASLNSFNAMNLDADGNPISLPGSVSTGQIQFELVVCFALGLGALIAPVFAANSVSGDRAGGTLAILQATLLTPGQLLWGKWLAAWVTALCFLVAAVPSLVLAAFNGALLWWHCFLMLLVVGLEFAILCGIGVGLSAMTSRPLFSILSTYLVVATLGLGTLLATGVAAMTVKETVRSSNEVPTQAALKAQAEYEALSMSDPEKYADTPYPAAANEMRCDTAVETYQAVATERFAWLLAANPVVLVADLAAPPVNQQLVERTGYSYVAVPESGPLAYVRIGVRQMQAGPQSQVACLAGERRTPPKLTEQAPVWPIGLGVQLVLTGALVFAGRRRLVTPAGKLAKGTRVA